MYSREGQSALAAQTSYTCHNAVGHRFDIHNAVATAAPYSACVLAYAAGFLYNQGFLCYRVAHEIRLLDVHAAGSKERVLNLYDILPRLCVGLVIDDASNQVELLRFADGIVVFRVNGTGIQHDTLFAIDMAERTGVRRKLRLLMRANVPLSAPVFVRHSRSYMWYGIFNEGSDGIWSVAGVDLAAEPNVSVPPIQFHLNRGIDSDLGQSFCFEIYKDHLYTVSTQVTSNDDERFSSFYHWSCYAPRDTRRPASGKLWRREHCEGPINEMWTDLSIRTDETTGQPVILECRREWPDGKSENHRTYYTQPLPVPEALEEQREEDAAPTSSKDEYSDDHTTSHNPFDQRPPKRLRRNYHAEYEPSHDQSQRKEFISARTKYRTYNLAASTFIDLVNDPAPVTAGVRTQDRLRLRAVSRKRKCPIDEEGTEGPAGLLFKPTQWNIDDIPVEFSEERFTSCGVHMWPAEDAPAELSELLCPDSRTSSVNAIADERSIIYSIESPWVPPGHKALIFVGFDPKIRFSTLKSLRSMKDPALRDQASPIKVPRLTSPNGSLVHESIPLYDAIDWGYWLR